MRRTAESFEQFVARINASAYLPPSNPTAEEYLSRKGPNMARQVKLPKGKEFEFKKSTGGAFALKYPWDEWFNGDLLLIERSDVDEDGEPVKGGQKRDYEVEQDAMPAKIKTAARRRYKVVQISKRDHEGKPLEHKGLIIRARDMDAAERQAEDQLRAEEKAARKEAKTAVSKNTGDEAAA